MIAGVCRGNYAWERSLSWRRSSFWGADIRLTAFIQLPFLPEFLSVLWIVALINVFNMLDNMDGLSGGVATIVSLMLAGAMWLTPDPDTDRPQLLISAMLFVIAGSLVGFLWHNFTPSRIFLGDAGAYFVGFFLAVATLLATFANYTEPRPHTVLVPLCVMALPLFMIYSPYWRYDCMRGAVHSKLTAGISPIASWTWV